LVVHDTNRLALSNTTIPKRVTIGLIQKRVSEHHFNLREQDLKVRSNTRAIAFPRQVAMYIVKQLTTASLPEIGRQTPSFSLSPRGTGNTSPAIRPRRRLLALSSLRGKPSRAGICALSGDRKASIHSGVGNIHNLNPLHESGMKGLESDCRRVGEFVDPGYQSPNTPEIVAAMCCE
jgi:hypothetical protein